MPKSLTGVDAEIVVMVAKDFPTGSHKVGPAYSCMIEKYHVRGELDQREAHPGVPSTGNYGIGGAWVSGRAGFKGMVILPEGMSRERFEQIESYGAGIIKTHGSESNVKEIYDECNRMNREHPDTVRILNQFAEMGNYRFHYHVTGNTAVGLEAELTRGWARAASAPFARPWAAPARSPPATGSSRLFRDAALSGWSRPSVQRSITTAMAATRSRASATSM